MSLMTGQCWEVDSMDRTYIEIGINEFLVPDVPVSRD